jgi:predicted secreted protein
MQLVSIAAIYFVLWWLVLFIVLPWGVKNAHEAGQQVEKGHASAAPVRPRMVLKFILTTIISAAIFAVIYYVIVNNLIKLDDIPFFPTFRPIQ